MDDSTPSSRFLPALLVLGAWLALVGLTVLPLARLALPIRLKPLDLLADVRVARPRLAGPSLAAPAPAAPVASHRVRPLRAVPEDGGQPIESAEPDALAGFEAALAESRRTERPVRIAYMSDSVAEGDLITQDLRVEFQRVFGGRGAGFLPIASDVARFRATVGHTFSSDWQVVSLMDRKRPFPVGIAGVAFAPSCRRDPGGATVCAGWVEYRATSPRDGLRAFDGLRVYYSHAETGTTLDCAWDGKTPIRIDLEAGPVVHEAVLIAGSPAKTVRLAFAGPAPLRIYGAAWDGPSGVTVDSLPLRGHSGLALTEIPADVLQAFDRLRHYDLVVLHYGVNVTSPDTDDVPWYQDGMERAIAHLRGNLPGSSLLVVSVSDRSYKPADDYETIPCVPHIVERQRRAAARGHAAFWNLFAAMGGEGSMLDWVRHDPPLAALDYTHFSVAGSRRVAVALFRGLMADYRKFDRRAD